MSATRSAPKKPATDPVLLAVARAPVGLPESDEERRMVAAAKAHGGSKPATDIETMLEERARREK